MMELAHFHQLFQLMLLIITASFYIIIVVQFMWTFSFFSAVYLGLRVSLTGPKELLDPQLLLSLNKEVSRLTPAHLHNFEGTETGVLGISNG